MTTIAMICVIVTAVCSCLYFVTRSGALSSIAVTFGTISYHLVIRLLAGSVVDGIMHNKADHTKRWFQCSGFEKKLYDRLRVKRWKGKMPTYNPELFDPRKHSWEEIVQASCQAEIVHEINVILSFVPILFSIWLGSAAVFVITSVFAAAYDLVFVIIQRYNRPRIIRFIGR